MHCATSNVDQHQPKDTAAGLIKITKTFTEKKHHIKIF